VNKILYKLVNGIYWAIKINIYTLFLKLLTKNKIIICIFNTESQFMHLESVLNNLQEKNDNLKFIFLLNPQNISVLNHYIKNHNIKGFVGSLFASKFLIFWDLVLTVIQSAHLPKIGKGIRICTFHGQPSKGNVYSHFRYKDIDGLFFYGPMMKEYYLEEKLKHDEWRDISLYEIGQPKSDAMFFNHSDKELIKEKLGIKNCNPIILYAPSFEYCNSMFQDGELIIKTLLKLDINLIIKPHPAIYNINDINRQWLEKLRNYSRNDNCIFFDKPNSSELINVIDILLTDYSGVAFDAFLLDKPVVFWESPLFYDEYLPSTYGIDGNIAKTKLYANVGRDGGIVVSDEVALQKAIWKFKEDKTYMWEERENIKNKLLYNIGNATEVATQIIINILDKKGA
jgi:hypothetical protein